MKKKINKFSVIVFLVYILFIILIIFGIIKLFNSSKKTNEVSVLNVIENYDYKLESNATDYYKVLFQELSEILSTEYDTEEYAKIVAKLFITDFYTLDNKLNKNDIGGLQFIYSNFLEDFVSYSMETVYKTVKNNIYGDRKQELPIVKEVIVDNFSESKFKYNNQELESYKVNILIYYEKDLGYPENVSLELIKNDKKVEVVKMKTN